MYNYSSPIALTFETAGRAAKPGMDRMPAAAGAAQRFEMLFAPSRGTTHVAIANTPASFGGLRQHIEALSRRWDAGQSSIMRLTGKGELTSQELMRTHMQVLNCAVDVEVSSKCASMFENGVQTLVQRGS